MKTYKAFISYSHADEVWGAKLHKTLERYSVPRKLVGGDSRTGPVPKRIFPIFRDREEFPTSADLGGAIHAALEGSDYLLVICSPRSAASRWVNEEILTFKRMGKADRVLCLIVDGEPGASNIAGVEDEECFPEAIQYHLDADGQISDIPAEPIAADARPGKDGWRNAWMKLAAGVLGVDFDALVQRDATRKKRRAALWAAAATIALSIAGYSYTLQQEARMAERRQAALLSAETAQDALNRGDEAGAYAALAQAFEIGLKNAPEAAHIALNRAALETRTMTNLPAPSPNLVDLRLLDGGALAAVDNEGSAYLTDLGTGESTQIHKATGRNIARMSDTDEILWTVRIEDERQGEDGQWFSPLLFEDIDLATGEVLQATAVKTPQSYYQSSDISPDGRFFAFDLGPGEAADTVVGVFHRHAQALAGLLTLPSDSADITFVDSEHLAAVIDPPSIYRSSPGIYLWRIGQETPLRLRAEGEQPICPTDADISATDVQALDVNGRLTKPHIAFTPDRSEVGLLLSDVEEGSCILRWSLPGGAPLPTLQFSGSQDYAHGLRKGGPWLARSDYSAAEAPGPNGDDVYFRECRKPPLQLFEAASGALIILCGGGDDGAIHFGASGEARWSGPMHEGGMTAAAFDPLRGRLITSGRDSRLRLWDAGDRRWTVGAGRHGLGLNLAGADRIVVIDPASPSVQLHDPDGGPLGPETLLEGVTSEFRVVPMTADHLFGIFAFTRPPFGQGDGDGAENEFLIIDGVSGQITGRHAGLRSQRGHQPANAPKGALHTLVKTDGSVILIDGNTGAIINQTVANPDAPIYNVAMYQDGGVLLTSNGVDDPEKREMSLLSMSGAGEISEIFRWSAQAAELTVSPDGGMAMVRLTAGEYPYLTRTLLLNLADKTETPLQLAPRSADWFSFSPDSNWLAITPLFDSEDEHGQPVIGPVIFNARTGAYIAQTPPADVGSPDPIWSPTNLLAEGGDHLRLHRFSAEGAEPICTALATTGARNVSFSSDGSRIILATEDERLNETIDVYDLKSCAPIFKSGTRSRFSRPLLPTADRLWAPFENEISVFPLSVPANEALAAIRERARLADRH
ncbi:MAG: TIR domain-containing protein [Pikeienuella sp.]